VDVHTAALLLRSGQPVRDTGPRRRPTYAEEQAEVARLGREFVRWAGLAGIAAGRYWAGNQAMPAVGWDVFIAGWPLDYVPKPGTRRARKADGHGETLLALTVGAFKWVGTNVLEVPQIRATYLVPLIAQFIVASGSDVPFPA
jgi:hypothetical protein